MPNSTRERDARLGVGCSVRFVSEPFALYEDVERGLAEYDVPALSVAVLCDRELACRTWGARTFDGDAITDRTLFQAGSVSNAVTALGVLRLGAQGIG